MKRESRTVDRSYQIDSPSQRHLPLVDLLVDTRADLMELTVASGLNVLHTMLEADRTAICGSRVRWSSVAAECRFAGCGFGRLVQKSPCRRFRRSPTSTR